MEPSDQQQFPMANHARTSFFFNLIYNSLQRCPGTSLSTDDFVPRSKKTRVMRSALKKKGKCKQPHTEETIGRFDIWPAESHARGSEGRRPETITIREHKSSLASAEVLRLAPGIALIRNFVSLTEQQRLVDICRHHGLQPGGFNVDVTKSGKEMKVRMMYFGQRWRATDGLFTKTAGTPELPPQLQQLSESVIKMLTADASMALPAMTADHCVVNFYLPTVGAMNIHQDADESPASIRAGLPVVSISVGDDAEFAYSFTAPSEPKKYLLHESKHMDTIRLRSGDVLVFGGPARLIYHGVEKIYARTAPPALRMRPGRLNLTLRQNDCRASGKETSNHM